MKLARAVKNLMESFERLPGIGPKTAARLTFYLMHVPQHELDNFASALSDLKRKTSTCSVCFNIDEQDPCSICSLSDRVNETILVVEQPLDVLAFEKGGAYNGLYHVLHGAISPINNIGPQELKIGELISRLKNGGVREIILATNNNLEGEATAMYISKRIEELGYEGNAVRVTRLAKGLPVGGEVEYADEVTLRRALEGRVAF